MGVWGTLPNQGDEPLDMFGFVEQAAVGIVEHYFSKSLDDPHARWARVGVLQETLFRGIAVKESIVRRAIADIDIVTDDERFVDTWKEPGAFIDDALWFREQLQSLLPDDEAMCRRRRRRRRGSRRRRRHIFMDRPVDVVVGWPYLNAHLEAAQG